MFIASCKKLREVFDSQKTSRFLFNAGLLLKLHCKNKVFPFFFTFGMLNLKIITIRYENNN